MITLLPMTDAGYAAFAAHVIPAYAAEKVACGDWTEDESLDRSRKSLDELLPQGKETPGHQLFTIVDAHSVAVGTLWIAVRERAGKRIAYVYDVEIKPEHRRKGHAAAAFQALERLAYDRGLAGIALHVFGHNAAAYALYAKLGFVTTDVTMFKALR